MTEESFLKLTQGMSTSNLCESAEKLTTEQAGSKDDLHNSMEAKKFTSSPQKFEL